MSVQIWIPTDCHSYSIPERIFQKVNFEKSQQMTKKHAKFPAFKELKTIKDIEQLESVTKLAEAIQISPYLP